jgi:hypothetical protein
MSTVLELQYRLVEHSSVRVGIVLVTERRYVVGGLQGEVRSTASE